MANWGLIGGIIGTLLGIAGGEFGCWIAIRHAQSQDERRLLIRASIAARIFVIAFLAALLVASWPLRIALWVAYAVLLPVCIILGNRRLAQVRAASMS